MGKRKGLQLILSTILILCSTYAAMGATRAQTGPRTPPTPPRPPGPEPTVTAVPSRVSTMALPPLKAVLIVGPIDGDYGEWTMDEKGYMDLAADALEANGVTVHKFYTPSNDWNQIKQAANGAHFLFYRGHGVYYPYIAGWPHPHVGGFALSSGIYDSDDIRDDLNLAPGAIVMLYGCFTAGHSGSSVDQYDIGMPEAQRRVAQYSDPFFDIGAAGYYANWWGSAFVSFVNYLFAGQTLGETFESYFDYNAATVVKGTHPDHPSMSQWNDYDYYGSFNHYNYAFVGSPDETLESLFGITPELGGLPTSVPFVYSIPDGEFLADSYQANTLNVSTQDVLTWTLTTEGSWFDATPGSGITPASFTIAPTTFNTNKVATYTGAITVTVSDPAGPEGSPHRIDVSLDVVDRSISRIYLPVVTRSYSTLMVPNDPQYRDQWALDRIDAPGGWARTCGCDAVLVAVIDTGVDLDHPDLASKVRTDLDWDFCNDDDDANDGHSHGTHVAGIAAAATDNHTGVAGVGWKVTILPLKALSDAGSGSESDVIEAIRYAADHGADVINMSLGSPSACSEAMQDAVDYAYGKGVFIVAASGNHGGATPNGISSPACCEHVLGIGATESDDSIADYSNHGDHVSVAAPGSSIYSTWNDGGYGYKWGTSMATPHVAGLAGLILTRDPGYTPDQVASAIVDNADDLGAAGWDPYYGCGRINAARSLTEGARGASPACGSSMLPWSSAGEDGGETLPADAPFVPGEILVSLLPQECGRLHGEQTLQRHGLNATFEPGLGAWRVRVPAGEEANTIRQLQADPAVAYAQLNHLVFTQ